MKRRREHACPCCRSDLIRNQKAAWAFLLSIAGFGWYRCASCYRCFAQRRLQPWWDWNEWGRWR